MEKYNLLVYSPLYIKPSLQSPKYLDMLDGSIVNLNSYDFVNGDGILFAEVSHQTNSKTYVGYVPCDYIEPFVPSLYNYDIIKIHNATPVLSDFAQNIIYKGNVQYNLCGEFSVLYCAGHYDIYIEDWLDTWALKSPNIFNRIFYGGKGKTTGISDLISMLKTFDGYPENFELISNHFKRSGKILFTPYKMQETLKNNRLIIGCKIEPRFGRLKATGIPHWSVIENIIPEGRGGLVDVYNPADNSVLPYSYETVIESVTKAPYGLVIPR